MTAVSKSQHIELFLAHLLRWGVATSFVIVAVGISLVVLTGQSGYQSVQLDDLNGIIRYQPGLPEYPNSIADVIAGVTALKPYAFIALGLLILIAIPVLRVAVSVLAFLLERDWIYVAITAFVLAMLVLSLGWGIGGG